MGIRCVFSVLAFLVVILYGLGRFESTSRYLMQVIRHLDEKITTVELVELQKQRASFLKLKNFVWDTCSGPDALARINELDISDPLSIPGDITITVDFVLKEDVQSPLNAAVRVKKKMGIFWIDVPCIDNIGSCDYEDLCALIPFKPVGEPCPEPFLSLKLPCACPFSQGNYDVKNFLVHVPDEPIPEILLGGEYSVHVQASMNSKEVICFTSEFVIA